ncbi:unnamed protein product [Auanema sp. JU1783]|nr:unnamed protein product [Auanema sp. JU1783]
MESDSQVRSCCKGHGRLKPQYLEVREDVDARLVDEMEKRNENSTISQVFDQMKAGVDVVSGFGNETMDAGKHVASAIGSRVRKLSVSMSDSVKQTAKDTANWVSSNVLASKSDDMRMMNGADEGGNKSLVIHHSLHGEKWMPDGPKTFSAVERAQERVAKRKSSEEKPEDLIFMASTQGLVEAIPNGNADSIMRAGLISSSDEGFSEVPANDYQDEGEDPELSALPPAPTSSPNPGEFVPQRFTNDVPSNLIHPRPVVSGCCMNSDEKMRDVNEWFNKSDAQSSTFSPFMTTPVAGSASSTGTSPPPHQKDCRAMLRQEADHMWGVGHSGNAMGPIDG